MEDDEKEKYNNEKEEEEVRKPHNSTPYILRNVIIHAAKGGHLHIIQWVVNEQDFFPDFFSEIYINAAKRGYLHIIKWAKEILIGNIYEYLEQIAYSAAQEGHLDIIKWAFSNGFKELQKTYQLARYNNHSHILSWIKEIGYIGSVSNNEESVEDSNEESIVDS